MEIYNYKKSTGEYLGKSTALADPEEQGRWLIPANSTTKKPPVANKNKVAVFKNGKWLLKDDYRGIEYWTKKGDRKKVNLIGEKIPGDASSFEISRHVTVEEVYAFIDKMAGTARSCFSSLGFMLGAEYQHVCMEAKKYIKTLEKDNSVTVPPSIATHAEIYNVSPEEAAKAIVEKAAQWFLFLEKSKRYST